jgi:4-hydroxy-3-polyprenylbenzoate decarboxylase
VRLKSWKRNGSPILGNRPAITLAITGASGAAYALRLLEVLLQQDMRVFLLISEAARIVFETEEDITLPRDFRQIAPVLQEGFAAEKGQLSVFGSDEWTAPVASGSGAPKQMIVCPCTMGTLAAIAAGASDNLLERAADVVIKERGNLILVPREMPYSSIHLENMLKLSRMGVTILPASPSFYNKPQKISDLVDSVVGRVLDHAGIEHRLQSRWGQDES